MAYSYVTFAGDGSTTVYSYAAIEMFPNTFLTHQSQLEVYVDGVLQTVTTDWSVTNTTTKQITFTSAPDLAAVIKIARSTQKDERLHEWTSGAIITANDLNNNDQQQFFIAQELADGIGDSVTLTPAGDKWDFEGKPTYNGAPAEDGNGFTTLNQVNALLDGSLVGTFDEVDSFKFTGDGTEDEFILTGVQRTGLTADAVLVQINGIMQDPDVFSPSHTPGSYGTNATSKWKYATLSYTDFQSGSSYNPTVVTTTSTLTFANLAAGEVAVAYYIRVGTTFTGGAPNVNVKYTDGVTDAYDITHLGLATDNPKLFDVTSTTSSLQNDGSANIVIALGTAGDISALSAGSIDIGVLVSSTSNAVTSVSGGASGSVLKYTMSYVSGTPRITFNTAPASGDVIVVRVLSGTFQGRIEDGSITTDMLDDDAVTAAKINVGAGTAGRVLIFDASGDGTASVPTASNISDFDTAVATTQLDELAVPTSDLDVNNNKIINLATGTLSTDAVTKAQLDAVAAATGITVAYSSGHNVPTVDTNYPIAYPSGFTTYPKAVFVRFSSASAPAYADGTGYSTDTVAFYTDAGGSQAKGTSVINHGSGAHTSMWIQITGTTTGITVKHNSTLVDYVDIMWIK